jgi:hypothetical protein
MSFDQDLARYGPFRVNNLLWFKIIRNGTVDGPNMTILPGKNFPFCDTSVNDVIFTLLLHVYTFLLIFFNYYILFLFLRVGFSCNSLHAKYTTTKITTTTTKKRKTIDINDK